MSHIVRRGPTVAVLAYDGMSGFETGIVMDVFGLLRPEIVSPWYELTVCAAEPVRLLGGATLNSSHGLEAFEQAETLIIPGSSDVKQDPPPHLLAVLRRAHKRGARIVSLCSGAFVLAAAGLLDGRRATTHWLHADLFRSRFPAVQLDPNVLYVDNGDVLTSAGSAAGLDLCLHLVRLDYGAAIANAIARRLVIQPHRDGGQAQFVEAPVVAEPDDDRITRSMTWALKHLDQPLSVEALARQAHMSTRTYLRHFTRCTGVSPLKWLLRQRLQASLTLLETTAAPIEEVAAAVGFDRSVTYRHHFSKIMKTSPSAYRRAFRTRAAAAP
jgi:AraC family transcriptional activator FtrA